MSACSKKRSAVRQVMLVLALLVMAFPASATKAAAPKVAVSILPLHALAAGVMAGVGAPELIMPAQASPHSFALRPSTAKILARADLIVWVGEGLEPTLAKPIAARGANASVLTLLEAKSLRLYAPRAGGAWAAHGHGEDGEHSDRDNADPHLWLDPENAKEIVELLVARLGALDPANAQAYAANGDRLRAKLRALDGELDAKLAPARAVPYMVFHDAFQYFERRYQLSAAGALTIDPDRAPGARRMQEIRAQIAARGVQCIFSEPQSPAAAVSAIAAATGIRTATLDDIGVGFAPGEDAYFSLLRGMADNLLGCLKPG